MLDELSDASGTSVVCLPDEFSTSSEDMPRSPARPKKKPYAVDNPPPPTPVPTIDLETPKHANLDLPCDLVFDFKEKGLGLMLPPEENG